MSNIAKANKLQEAVRLLEQVNKLQQEALDASDESYNLHNTLEDLMATLEEYAEQLVEMQVTE